MATLLVGWLSLRMWNGESVSVWRASVVLAAFAPFAAAAVFRYIVAVAEGESSVFSAWLVRAISMHWVLVWMVGSADLLRGMPGHPSGRNWDALAPLILLAFFPAFGANYGALCWVRSLERRAASHVLRPTRPGERALAVPVRGVSLVREEHTQLRSLRLSMLAAVTGLFSVLMAPTAMRPSVVACTALVLALATAHAQRGYYGCAGVLATLVAIAQTRAISLSNWMSQLMATPWLALASVGLYLAALETATRVRLAREGARRQAVAAGAAQSVAR